MTSISSAEEEAERLPLRESFIRALLWVMEEKDPPMSQRELAEGMGWTSHTRIQPWQRLRSEPRPHEVFALEGFLGLDPGTLSHHLGYVPVGAEARLAGVEEAIDADPLLPDWAKRLLKANYAEIRNNYVHSPGRRKRA